MKLDPLQREYLGVLRNYHFAAVRKTTDHQVYDSIHGKKHIIDIFRMHPDWRENELRIVMTGERERKFVYEAIRIFSTYLKTNCETRRKEDGEETFLIREKVVEFIECIMNHYFSENVDYYTPYIKQINSDLEAFRTQVNSKAGKTVLRPCAETLRSNMKASKAIMKLCTETNMHLFPDFNKQFSMLADNINPSKKDVISIWSINPADYLLMSNGSNWESCHYIGDHSEGFHMAGCISYMLDTDSFLYFEIEPQQLGDITYAPKVVRQVFGYNDMILFQSRLYPQANDCGAESAYEAVRNKTQNVIAQCLGEPSNWLTSQRLAHKVPYQDCDAAYDDWNLNNPGSKMCHVSVLKSRPNGTDGIEGSIYLGAEPTSVVTGNVIYNYDDLE